MSEDISCEVFRITFPDWSSVGDEIKEKVWTAIKVGAEDGEPPSRRAFVGVNRIEDVIVGFFAHEGLRVGVQYDAAWKPEARSRAEFEHLFFAFVLSQGNIVLQRKRVPRAFVALNLPTLRRACFDLLTLVFQRAGLPVKRITLEPFRQERDKSALLAIFDKYPVTFVRVQGLLGRQVPEDVKLFNPDEHRDLILKQVLKDDFSYVDVLEASSGEVERGATLRSAKVVRAAMLAGEPQVVKAIVDNHERTFRKTQTEGFDTQLDAEPGLQVPATDAERMIRIIRTEYYIPASLAQGSVDFGPLFQLAREEGDNHGN